MRRFLSLAFVLASAGTAAAQGTPAFSFSTISGAPNVRAIVTADFNGDGHLDVATANDGTPSSVAVFLGAGDGTFALNGHVTIPAGAFGIASADFNHDGRADLVVTSADSHAISILKWASTGFVVTNTLSSPGGDPRFVVAADFNRDGNPDIAYTSFTCGCVEVWTSDRAGDVWTMRGSFKTGQGAHGLAVADVDLDGALDLVVTNSLANSVTVLYGEDNGIFLVGPTMKTGSTPRSVAVADFNLDGAPDLAVINTGSNNISLFMGVRVQPSDSTPPPAPFTARTLSGLPFSSPRDIAAVDLNTDARVELVVASYGNDTVYILDGDGAGHFGQTEGLTTVAEKDAGSGPRTLAFGDFDEDGRIDIVAGDQKIGDVSVFLNRTPFITHFR